MGEPIKIIVTAETAEAAAKLQDFVQQYGSGMNSVLKETATHAGHAAGALGQNRLAMMELGHVARATGESLAFGMNPLRILALESPRILQAATMMNDSMKASIIGMLPVVGGVVAAVGVGVLAWKAMRSEEERLIERNNELVASFKKLPEVIAQINKAATAGALTPDLRDKLLGKVGLNVGGQGSPFSAQLATARGLAVPTVNAQAPQHISLSAFGLPDAADMRAAQDELFKLGILLKEVDAKGNVTYSVNPQIEALEKLTQMRQRDAAAMASGLDKERIEAKTRHDENLVQLNEALAQARNFQMLARQKLANEKNPEIRAGLEAEIANYDPSKFDGIRAEFEAEYQRKISDIDRRAQEERNRKDKELLQQWTEEKKKIVADQDRALSDAIEANREQTSDKTKKIYEDEYVARMDQFRRQLDAGLIEEDEFTHKVQAASKERVASEKQYHAELARTAQLKQEIARSEAETQLRGIQTNPFLTNYQKSQSSVPVIQGLMDQNEGSLATQKEIAGSSPDESARLQAMQRINELMREQQDWQLQLNEARGADSWNYQLGKTIIQLQNIDTWAQQTGALLENSFRTATDSISSNLTRVIMGTMSWGQALRNISTSVVNEVISSLIRMAVQHLIIEKMMTVATQATSSATTASSQVAAHAAVAGAGAASAEAQIPYVGPILAIAAMAAVIAAVIGMCSGFSEGGYTGAGGKYDVAGLVHRGEFVMPADRIGLGPLEAMRGGAPASAAGMAAAGAGGGALLPPKVVTVFDRAALMEELKKPDYGHITIQHVLANKTRIGIPT